MQFTSALSLSNDCSQATDELLEQTLARIEPGEVDLVTLFSAGHDPDELEKVADQIKATFHGAVSLGCTAEGLIASDRELENRHAMVLMAGQMPGVEIETFQMLPHRLEECEHLSEYVSTSSEASPAFVAFGDPYTCDIQRFLDLMNTSFPGAALLGGMASGAPMPGGNRLLLNGFLHDEGLVGIALTGNIQIDTVVSQGCRPIGKHFIITDGEHNIIRQLGGCPAVEALHDVITSLPEIDRKLLQRGLFVGRVIDETKRPLDRGDFLIQNVVGVDQNSGALAISGQVRKGTTIQFHVRDARSADEDLRQLLAPHAVGPDRPSPIGALLFSCNGRGTRMWSEANHDISVVRELCGRIPVAGFFCAGELGPIGGKNFIHGFTASIGLLRPGT